MRMGSQASFLQELKITVACWEMRSGRQQTFGLCPSLLFRTFNFKARSNVISSINSSPPLGQHERGHFGQFCKAAWTRTLAPSGTCGQPSTARMAFSFASLYIKNRNLCKECFTKDRLVYKVSSWPSIRRPCREHGFILLFPLNGNVNFSCAKGPDKYLPRRVLLDSINV